MPSGSARPCGRSPVSRAQVAQFGFVCPTRNVAAARLHAQEGPVAVEVRPPAGEVGEGIEELAVVGTAGAELVVDRLVEGRGEDLARAEADPVELRQRHRLARLGGAGEARGAFAQQPRGAAGLLAREQRPGLFDPGPPGRDPVGQFGDRWPQLDRPGAQRRQRTVEVDQRAVEGLQRRRQMLDRGREVGRLRGEGAGEDVEVDDQALEVLLVPGEGAEGAAGAGDEPGEVMGLGAEQGVGDLGAVLTGVAAVMEGAVERLRRRSCPALPAAGPRLRPRSACASAPCRSSPAGG